MTRGGGDCAVTAPLRNTHPLPFCLSRSRSSPIVPSRSIFHTSSLPPTASPMNGSRHSFSHEPIPTLGIACSFSLDSSMYLSRRFSLAAHRRVLPNAPWGPLVASPWNPIPVTRRTRFFVEVARRWWRLAYRRTTLISTRNGKLAKITTTSKSWINSSTGTTAKLCGGGSGGGGTYDWWTVCARSSSDNWHVVDWRKQNRHNE